MTCPPPAEARLRIRPVLLLIFLLVASKLSAQPSSRAEAARLLDGDWRNETFVLRVDAERAQASVSPDRPFEWKRFVVREIAGDEVIFAIGAELYEARIDDDAMTLTGTSFFGTEVLFRDAALRGTMPQ